ncbi:GumC family protein [Hymenobacter psoromatis]|uniref:GumC family protein n=1 Tax=Hymenobacter psoromatis TaxID=1484116 RepID=UPI001CBED8D8|nr:polysaccharide biosynthesis tyrosine autokinase [Hymenobacter psoromatis]
MSSNELFPLASEQPEAKSIAHIVRQYAKYWYLFVLSIGICLGVAYFYLKYLAVPQYSIYSTVLIKEDKNSSSAATAETFNLNLFAPSKNFNNEIEVLESNGLMERVAVNLGLTTTYHRLGRFRNVELYGDSLPIHIVVGKLSPKVINKSILLSLKQDNAFTIEEEGKSTLYHFGQLIHRPYGDFTVLADSTLKSPVNALNNVLIVGFHSPVVVAGGFSQQLQIVPLSKEATVLKISITDALPQRGRDIINELVKVYNSEAIEDKNLMATNTIHFLDERLGSLTKELTGVEKNVERYKSQNGVTDVTTQATNYLEQASDYNKKLSDWEAQIDVLKSIESYLNTTTSQAQLVPSTLGIQDQTLLGLIGKFNELQLERERMLRTTEPGNPLVMNMNQQLDNLKTNILENLRNIKNGLLITSNNLRASSGLFKSRIQKVPVQERELQDINRQQETKQKLYLFLLQKREEAGLSLAATVANTRIVDTATSSDYPIKPSKQIVYLVALLIGCLLPFAGIFSKDLLNDKIQSQQDIAALTATPILGELVHNTQDNLVMIPGNRSPLAEMFRLVRTNLHFAANGQDQRVIMVTSSMSNEGKTFFSLNLGATLALTGKRVVVLEMDLRQPALLQALGTMQPVGITDYLLSGSYTIQDVVHASEQATNLFVMSAGKLVANPAELMMSPKLGYLIHELRERFDYVIIDTAPIGKVADAFNLRAYVDQTVYLVRYNYTLKSQLGIIDNVFVNHKLPNPLIVLNDMRLSTREGYGYGYGEDKNKKHFFSRATTSAS